MVSGTLLQVDTRSIEDIHLYGNPKITYFKSSFNKGRNFATNYSKIPLGDTSIDFGSTIKFKVPIKGDLLGGIYLNFKLNNLVRTTDYIENGVNYGRTVQWSSYVNGIGYNIIDNIELFINGTYIQSINSELIYILNSLHNNNSKQDSFNYMTNFIKPSISPFKIGVDNVSEVKCQLQIPFFFSRNPGYYLPLCSLTNSTIEVHIKLKTLDKCIIKSYNAKGFNDLGTDGSSYNTETEVTTPLPTQVNQYDIYNEEVTGGVSQFDVVAQYVHLDNDDRKIFMTMSKLEYLVELFHIGAEELISNPVSSQAYYFDMTSKHPTKYIIWMLQRKDVNNSNMFDNYTYDFSYRYSHGKYLYSKNFDLLDKAEILVNNTPILDDMDPVFLSNIQLYEKFEGSFQMPMYIYGFALNPLNVEPSGTLNLSTFRNKQFRIELVDDTNYTNNNIKSDIQFRYYSSYYNILVIKDGMGGLIYQ